jgi:predicted MFS family arabinose efflux permease
MFDSLRAILSHTPLWVFALFAVLVFLGIRRMRPRPLKLGQMLLGPLILITITLPSVIQRALHPPAGAEDLTVWMPAVWALACAAGGFIGGRVVHKLGVTRIPGSDKLMLQGSPWPLVIYVFSFSAKYFFAVSFAREPALLRDHGYLLAEAGLGGLLAGLMLGRTLLLVLKLRAARNGGAPLI